MKRGYCATEEKFWRWLASKISKHLVYWASLRLMANIPKGQYIGGEIPNILTYDALRKWSISNYT